MILEQVVVPQVVVVGGSIPSPPTDHFNWIKIFLVLILIIAFVILVYLGRLKAKKKKAEMLKSKMEEERNRFPPNGMNVFSGLF